MIIDNVSDFTHAWLHRKYQPFADARLTRCEAVGDRVLLSYDTQVGMGRISRRFVDRRRVRTDAIELCYEYPYQWSDTGGKIKHWCFVLPIDARTTRVFFLFYFESLKIPLTPFRIPRRLMTLALRLSNRLLIRPLLRQDGFAVEAEQRGHEAHPGRPAPDLNPAVGALPAADAPQVGGAPGPRRGAPASPLAGDADGAGGESSSRPRDS